MDKHNKNGSQSYVFLLKEGKTISNNCMDYSLLMLHTSCLETMNSPLPPNAIKRYKGPIFLSLKEELMSQNISQS